MTTTTVRTVDELLAEATLAGDTVEPMLATLAEVRLLEEAGYMTGYSVNPVDGRPPQWTADGVQAVRDAHVCLGHPSLNGEATYCDGSCR